MVCILTYMKRIKPKQKVINDKHLGVLALYKSGKFTTEQIARNYNLSPRQVQRIAKNAGIIRTLAESNKLIAPLKRYHTIPLELRVQRKQLSLKLRFAIIAANPFCTNCGRRPNQGIRLEVDHKDENPQNNDPTNLQVLCSKCNVGKSHGVRYATS